MVSVVRLRAHPAHRLRDDLIVGPNPSRPDSYAPRVLRLHAHPGLTRLPRRHHELGRTVVPAHRRAGLRRNGRRQLRAVGKDLRAEPATTVPPDGPGAHVGDRPWVRGLGDNFEPPGRFGHRAAALPAPRALRPPAVLVRGRGNPRALDDATSDSTTGDRHCGPRVDAIPWSSGLTHPPQ